MMDIINLLPPKVQVVILSLWLLWKVVVVVIFIHVALSTTSALSTETSEEVSSARNLQQPPLLENKGTPRILYIVTTLAEFNNGLRKTEKGQDRLGEVLIPILVDSVESMVHEPFNYHVDVYLIAAYELKKEREDYIRSRLPDGVGLEVW